MSIDAKSFAKNASNIAKHGAAKNIGKRSGPIDLDLLPRPARRPLFSAGRGFLLLAIAVGLAFGGGAGYTLVCRLQLDREAARLAEQQETLKSAEQTYNAVTARLHEIDSVGREVDTLFAGQQMLTLLSELNRQKPATVRFTHLGFTGSRVTVQGTGENSEDVARFVTGLGKSEAFFSVVLESVTARVGGGQSFTLTVQLPMKEGAETP